MTIIVVIATIEHFSYSCSHRNLFGYWWDVSGHLFTVVLIMCIGSKGLGNIP